jgi:hypothetical protein
MECHHIVPQSKGGDDSYENCIPLCFDCHAEVGHYSDDHPKGTKFSSAEVRGCRDHWYSAYASGVVSGAPGEHEELDRKLFLRLYDLLGGSKRMQHFREHDYGGGFQIKIEHGLSDFEREAGFPQTEFFDAQMAGALGDLVGAVRAYQHAAVGRVWFSGEYASIPAEWQGTQDERFDEAVETMNQVATKVWDAFVQFVKTARIRLKTAPE